MTIVAGDVWENGIEAGMVLDTAGMGKEEGEVITLMTVGMDG